MIVPFNTYGSFIDNSYFYTEKHPIQKMMVYNMEGSSMLNFLYNVPLKTRVKSSNGKVGRKYANYAKVL